MLSPPGKDLTNCLTFRVDRDCVAHRALQGECVSLSHRVGFPCHYYDKTKRGNVTDGRALVSLVTPRSAQQKGRALMDEHDWLAEQFEAERPHLHAVAYRMLGSLSEADDAVQEAWLRLSRADTSDVQNLRAWLTTVVARVALNTLRSRKTRREQSLDVHVPDPVIDPTDGTDPEHEALLADSVGLALLIVLETLTPAERLAFVLHDMFAVPFEE